MFSLGSTDRHFADKIVCTASETPSLVSPSFAKRKLNYTSCTWLCKHKAVKTFDLWFIKVFNYYYKPV